MRLCATRTDFITSLTGRQSAVTVTNFNGKETCANCRFSKLENKGFECRFGPPVFSGNVKIGSYVGVMPGWWCGRYERDPSDGVVQKPEDLQAKQARGLWMDGPKLDRVCRSLEACLDRQLLEKYWDSDEIDNLYIDLNQMNAARVYLKQDCLLEIPF